MQASRHRSLCAAAHQQKAGEEAMKKIAADVCVPAPPTGRTPTNCRKKRYVAAGLPGTPPNTKMEKVRRTTLPPAHISRSWI